MNLERTLSRLAFATLLLPLTLQAGCAAAGAVRPAGPPVAAGGLAVDPGIESAVRAMNEVCARRDLAGFMALFEDSDDIALVGSDDGEVFRGRSAVAGFVQRLFKLPFSFSFELPSPLVRQRGDTAWVFVDGAMVHAFADGRTRQVPYRITAVLVRLEGGWRWQLFSGSSPRPG